MEKKDIPNAGRNDPCPCGSGKKYKNCCLKKPVSSFETGNIAFQQANYDYVTKPAREIVPILKKYKLEDLIRAAFCMNAWRPNRSAFSQCYLLNQAICFCNSHGTKRITSYNQFCDLYNRLQNIMDRPMQNDPVIDDFGEVFINYKNMSYPIIIGTGGLEVYPLIK